MQIIKADKKIICSVLDLTKSLLEKFGSRITEPRKEVF